MLQSNYALQYICAPNDQQGQLSRLVDVRFISQNPWTSILDTDWRTYVSGWWSMQNFNRQKLIFVSYFIFFLHASESELISFKLLIILSFMHCLCSEVKKTNLLKPGLSDSWAQGSLFTLKSYHLICFHDIVKVKRISEVLNIECDDTFWPYGSAIWTFSGCCNNIAGLILWIYLNYFELQYFILASGTCYPLGRGAW